MTPAIPGRCGTCHLWKHPSGDWEFDKLVFGNCDGIRHREAIRARAIEGLADVDRWSPGGVALMEAAMQAAKAFCTDASSYNADVYTQADFGCTLWEERRPDLPPPPDPYRGLNPMRYGAED